MTPVFISHSSEDRYVVNLIAVLLEFHGIATWCSSEDIRGSHQYRSEIDKALENAGSLIVVVSRHSAQSKWVIKEFIRFQTLKPEAPVLPILLDDTQPMDLVDGLEVFQSVDFHACMKTGFEKVLAVYGKTFLPSARKKKIPKELDRREQSSDRRTSDIRKRLRVGFQISYTRAITAGTFNMSRLVADTLMDEARRYFFTNQAGEKIDPQTVLREAMDHVWSRSSEDERGNITALIERIAETIHQNYTVEMKDRRNGEL
jgi:hypothetical protein